MRVLSMIFILIIKEHSYLNSTLVCIMQHIMPYFLFFPLHNKSAKLWKKKIFIWYYLCYLPLHNKQFTLKCHETTTILTVLQIL